jgi:hypothetical protein
MTRSNEHGRRLSGVPVDPRNPGNDYIQHEIDTDRLGERILIPKAIFALVIVAVLVVIRQVFFA